MTRKTKHEEFRKWVKSYNTYILDIPIKGFVTGEFSVVAYDYIEAKKIALKNYPDVKPEDIKFINSYKNL